MASTARGNHPLTNFVWQHLQLWLIHWSGQETVGQPIFVQQGRCNPSHNGLSRKHNYSSNTDGALPTSWSIGGCLGQPSPLDVGKLEGGRAMPHFILHSFQAVGKFRQPWTPRVSFLHHEGHHATILCVSALAMGTFVSLSSQE